MLFFNFIFLNSVFKLPHLRTLDDYEYIHVSHQYPLIATPHTFILFGLELGKTQVIYAHVFVTSHRFMCSVHVK